jgi:hypothetical protein
MMMIDHRKSIADKAASTNADSGKSQRHHLCSAIDLTAIPNGFVCQLHLDSVISQIFGLAPASDIVHVRQTFVGQAEVQPPDSARCEVGISSWLHNMSRRYARSR